MSPMTLLACKPFTPDCWRSIVKPHELKNATQLMELL